jgi:hypothetical protein
MEQIEEYLEETGYLKQRRSKSPTSENPTLPNSTSALEHQSSSQKDN